MTILDKERSLERVISSLDISPTDYETARSRYSAVADWLREGVYVSGQQIDIYLQGSFRLGTVVRPYRNNQNADYDIDQVCEITGRNTQPSQLKHDVGNRLKENGDYERMLDDEGRRCWTLNYASAENRPGFHLDVLPSKLSNPASTHIDITQKAGIIYSWRTSNPKGYYYWFKGKNGFGARLYEEQSRSIYLSNRQLYESAENVPKQLIRTPLQRSIQLMKRHRDVYFDGKEYPPISIILTTICTHQYRGENILETLISFTEYVISRFAVVVSGQALPIDNVLDYQNDTWIIKNPAASAENFADKWIEEPALAESFFAWVYQLRRDIKAFNMSSSTGDLRLMSPYQETTAPYAQMLLEELREGRISSNNSFLNLIHLGIKGEVDWDRIVEVAVRNVDDETDQNSKDVAWINYYQIKIHSGRELTIEDKEHIRSILRVYSNSSDFVLCCNLLLGSATAQMLQACILARDNNVLDWPIMKLAKGQIREHSGLIIPFL